MRWTIVVLGLLTTLISACSTNPSKPNIQQHGKTAWLTHKKALADVQDWQFSGRFGAKTDTENWNGSISWSQHNQQYKINISGPLSSGSIQLEGADNISQLKLSEKDSFVDTDPQSLLQTHTGLKLPVKELRFWLLGLPAPDSHYDAIEINAAGQINHLKQNHWQINFKRYTSVNGKMLPNKIFLKNHEINVRLIIQKWEILS